MKSVIFVFVIITGILGRGNSEDCKGCVPLDSLSFDKVIGKFKTAVVKFDVAFPYGEKHEAFANVAAATNEIEDLLMAEVGIKDYGNKDNSDLAKRFNIEKNDLPVILLFIKGKSEPLKLLNGKSEDFTTNNIKRLIRTKTGVYLGLPGCIEKLDRLAEEFKISGEKERQKIFDKTKALEASLPEQDQPAAKIYVKTMERIIERGDEFVQSEETRIVGLLKKKLSTEKKRSMEERRNILQSFTIRDEL